MKYPIVSVVIPTINGREELLERALDSVEKQTYKNIEIIVVDEGLSANKQRNIGISKSNGEYIAFLDDDDVWYKTKIERQMEVMKKYPDCPLVTCYLKDYRFNRIRIDKPPFVANQGMIVNAFTYSSTSTYLVKQDSLVLVGGFDESLPSAQEYEIAIRLSKDENVRCVGEILVEQHHTNKNISEDWDKKRIGISLVCKKHKRLYSKYSKINWIKLLGIKCLYLFAKIFGNRIYTVINIVRR